jgi:hypothetical protein
MAQKEISDFHRRWANEKSHIYDGRVHRWSRVVGCSMQVWPGCVRIASTLSLSQNDLLSCRAVPCRAVSCRDGGPQTPVHPGRRCHAWRLSPGTGRVYHLALRSTPPVITVQQGQRRWSCIHAYAAIPKLLAEHRAQSHTALCQLLAAQACLMNS